MILAILQAIAGILLVLFIPGYLLSLIFFKDMDHLKSSIIGVGLSIAISTILAFILTFVGNITGTKGITTTTVSISLVALSLLFLEIIVYRKVKGKSK